ncbi:hypothetical protein H4217_009059 [Coemansia sp. RSA 1939]|nr:hypothetical protein H4217_009059 [Coemansia sp. RSA 1939]KAJ2589268.1 hypothetical protein EV177_009272 [Coemansia sp. RSA 1804]KAJ2652191.1 hypothetical protein GGH99_007609 [Coemansia sp. RSA 1285]
MHREGSEQPGSDGDSGGGIERAASDLARYALACNAAGKPMRREGIRDTVMGGSSGARNMKQVLERASQLLEQTMGLKIVALPAHEKTILGDDTQALTQTQTQTQAASASTQAAATTAKATNKWVLVSSLPDDTRLRLEPAQSTNDRAIAGFAAVVLSLIFVNNMSVGAEQLVLFVRKLGPPDCALALASDSASGSSNSARGGLTDAQMDSAAREAIDYLVRAGFLDKATAHAQGRMDAAINTQATQNHQHDASFEYTWGPLAKTRFAPLDMARFVAEMTGVECSADFIKTISRAYGRTIGPA